MDIEYKSDIIAEENEDALLADGFEAALIGICYRFGQPPLACYNYDLCIQILMKEGMSDEEAMEYFEYNVLGSWVGEGTPVFVKMFDDMV